MDITKIIIPAAASGTRFLPYAKSVPRHMLPILRKPALQHVMEEAVASSIANAHLVLSRGQDLMGQHFDYDESTDPAGHIDDLNKVLKNCQLSTIKQHELRGSGHAVWLARNVIGAKEYFGVAYPDDLIFGKQPALAQLMRIARQEKVSVIAVQDVPSECLSSYGIIGIKKSITPNLFQVGSIVEKPSIKDAPSTLAVVGRYILSSKIMQTLDKMVPAEEEIGLTDALNQLLMSNERILAYKVQGTRYDIGTHLGWVKAVISTSLQDTELGTPLKSFLSDMDTPQSFLYNPAKMIQDNF